MSIFLLCLKKKLRTSCPCGSLNRWSISRVTNFRRNISPQVGDSYYRKKERHLPYHRFWWKIEYSQIQEMNLNIISCCCLHFPSWVQVHEDIFKNIFKNLLKLFTIIECSRVINELEQICKSSCSHNLLFDLLNPFIFIVVFNILYIWYFFILFCKKWS